MPGVSVTQTHPEGRYRASCTIDGCGRPLDWTVDTEEHAVNVANKHLREHHPGLPLLSLPGQAPAESLGVREDGAPLQVNLSAAAAMFRAAERTRGGEYAEGARAVWEFLLTASHDEADKIADALNALRQVVHAYTPPF